MARGRYTVRDTIRGLCRRDLHRLGRTSFEWEISLCRLFVHVFDWVYSWWSVVSRTLIPSFPGTKSLVPVSFGNSPLLQVRLCDLLLFPNVMFLRPVLVHVSVSGLLVDHTRSWSTLGLLIPPFAYLSTLKPPM